MQRCLNKIARNQSRFNSLTPKIMHRFSLKDKILESAKNIQFEDGSTLVSLKGKANCKYKRIRGQ